MVSWPLRCTHVAHNPVTPVLRLMKTVTIIWKIFRKEKSPNQMCSHCIHIQYRRYNPLQRPNCFCMSDTVSLPFVLVLVSGLLLRYLESLSEVLFLFEISDMHLLCSSRYDL